MNCSSFSPRYVDLICILALIFRHLWFYVIVRKSEQVQYFSVLLRPISINKYRAVCYRGSTVSVSLHTDISLEKQAEDRLDHYFSYCPLLAGSKSRKLGTQGSKGEYTLNFIQNELLMRINPSSSLHIMIFINYSLIHPCSFSVTSWISPREYFCKVLMVCKVIDAYFSAHMEWSVAHPRHSRAAVGLSTWRVLVELNLLSIFRKNILSSMHRSSYLI